MLTCSHLTITSRDVPNTLTFLSRAFQIEPKFANDEFGEYVLPSGFRLAVFKVTGSTRKYFSEDGERGSLSIGVTVEDVESTFERIESMASETGAEVSGPPKDHPWGERSFLLIDPDGNRWEVTQSPSQDGTLVDR